MKIYWKSVRFICDIYKENLQNGEALPSAKIEQHGLASELVDEADQLLESQSPVEILKFVKEIESQLRNDISVQQQEKYWKSLL